MKRIKILSLILAMATTLVFCKLAYVSLVDGSKLSKMAIAQRSQKVEITSPRGIIYDRNMIKITGAEMQLLLDDGKPYYTDRVNTAFLSHVIGYISGDGKGTGIEGAFDYVLAPEDSSSISYLKDLDNNMISDGYSIDVDGSYKGVSLTIDYHIQKIVEEIMDEYGINGSAIVLEAGTGEVLAMTSRPNFDRKRLADFLGGTNGELINKAITEYNPGSVFKVIVAAAALENNVNEDIIINCEGERLIDGKTFSCHKETGHGDQTLQTAFANSCNVAFFDIANQIGAKEIYKYARLFGIGDEVLKINGIKEDFGNVPATVYGMQNLANISIGQGDVMVTPLQMADVLCTLINGGMRKQITLIRGLVDENGECQTVQPTDLGRVVASTTARRLTDMMRVAVSKGTGKSADIEGYGSGGKTGTAETGWMKNGELVTQGWFCGFFPADDPKYICVIMAENGKSGSESACPVFKDIGTAVCRMHHY